MFKKEDLLTEQKIAEYKNIAQEQLPIFIIVENAFMALDKINKNAISTITCGDFIYQNYNTNQRKGTAKFHIGGSFYNVITVYLNESNLIVNYKYQLRPKKAVSECDYIGVAFVSYSYDSQTQEISINDCFDTEEYIDRICMSEKSRQLINEYTEQEIIQLTFNKK